MSVSRLFGRRTESSGESVVSDRSAFLSYLNGFRPEFAVADAGANFHLWPDSCDGADDFSAVVDAWASSSVVFEEHKFHRSRDAVPLPSAYRRMQARRRMCAVLALTLPVCLDHRQP